MQTSICCHLRGVEEIDHPTKAPTVVGIFRQPERFCRISLRNCDRYRIGKVRAVLIHVVDAHSETVWQSKAACIGK